MDVLLKAAAVAVVGSALGLVVKKNSPEVSLLLAAAVSLAVLYTALTSFRSVMDFTGELTRLTDMPSASVSAVMKAVGIAIVTRFAADVCKDSGQTAAASSVELAGTAASLFVALPLMETVLNMIKSLL
jgi:stage III sporulation protein AD